MAKESRYRGIAIRPRNVVEIVCHNYWHCRENPSCLPAQFLVVVFTPCSFCYSSPNFFVMSQQLRVRVNIPLIPPRIIYSIEIFFYRSHCRAKLSIVEQFRPLLWYDKHSDCLTNLCRSNSDTNHTKGNNRYEKTYLD